MSDDQAIYREPPVLRSVPIQPLGEVIHADRDLQLYMARKAADWRRQERRAAIWGAIQYGVVLLCIFGALLMGALEMGWVK